MSEESDKPTAEAGPETGPSGPDLECEAGEYVIPGPEMPNGDRLVLHHHADHSFTSGVMRQTPDGRPLRDDAVLVEPREGTPYYNVVGTVAELKKGPSKVNSPAFKRGWDNIFGKKPEVGQA